MTQQLAAMEERLMQQLQGGMFSGDGLASDRALLHEIKPESTFFDVLASTDLGHTIMVLASNLLLQIVFYAYFRSLMLQLEEPSYSYLQQQHPDQMTVAQAEAFISANVAKLMEIQFKTDAYSSLN